MNRTNLDCRVGRPMKSTQGSAYIRTVGGRNRLLGWGSNALNALGLAKTKDARAVYEKATPLPVESLLSHESDYDTPVPISVAAGYGHSVFAMQSGLQTAVFGMGLNTSLQLGSGPESSHFQEVVRLSPKQRVKALGCGRAHTAVLLASATSEELVMLGDNTYGQLGCTPSKTPTSAVTVQVRLPDASERIKDVVCGLDHTLLLTDQGNVLATGWNADGQLGDGGIRSRGVFEKVNGLPEIVKVSTKADMNLALTRNGRVFAWGNNEYGQHLITPKETRVLQPIQLPLVDRVFDIAAGGSFILLMLENGSVMSIGFGLGLGQGSDVVESLEPKLVQGLPKEGVVEVHASVGFAMAITADRRMFTWGAGRQGQLGLSPALSDEFTAHPVPVDKSSVQPQILNNT